MYATVLTWGLHWLTVAGTGTSPGRVRGRARIVHQPSASRLEQGDILIAEHTDPGWTPVLHIVGAVVSEEGGMLNHCSIVARELGIPAVVGIARATQRIREGTDVTVDGSAGTVHIHSGELDRDSSTGSDPQA